MPRKGLFHVGFKPHLLGLHMQQDFIVTKHFSRTQIKEFFFLMLIAVTYSELARRSLSLHFILRLRLKVHPFGYWYNLWAR